MPKIIIKFIEPIDHKLFIKYFTLDMSFIVRGGSDKIQAIVGPDESIEKLAKVFEAINIQFTIETPKKKEFNK